MQALLILRFFDFWIVFQNLSEKRGSNPRPQPWQGCALPAELFSLFTPFVRWISWKWTANLSKQIELSISLYKISN